MVVDASNKKGRFPAQYDIKVLVIVVTLILSAVGFFFLFSPLPAEENSRTVNPPGKPSNPTPANDATGLIGPTITLSWQNTAVYRGDHKAITNTWLKVSTQGPCNSDGATANIFNGALGPTTSYQLSGSSVKMSTTYYWAAKTEDEEGWGPYSNWKFSTNALPVASITSITPSQAREGQEVVFVGEGADNIDNDEIIAYKWESNIDGEISDQKSFNSKDLERPLTPGIHQITFKVQDENELWSEVTSQCKRNLEITVNTPPSTPAGFEVDGDTLTDDGELTTHKLSPRIKWRPSTDPDPEDSVGYYISISTQRTHERSIADGEKITVPEFNIPGMLSYGSLDSFTKTMSNSYYIEIFASDGYKNSDVATAEFKVVNHPPGAPTIEIDPPSPKSNEAFFCNIVSNSNDPDGDNIQYTYKWYNNGKYQEKLSGKGPEYAQIRSEETTHFETWKVEVFPTDGYIEGDDIYEEMVIENVPPVARFTNPLIADPPKYLEDSFYTIEEITFDASDSYDPDGDQIKDADYVWTSNISGPIGKGPTLKKKIDTPGEHLISLQVTDQHGASSNITTVIFVEEPQKPILCPVFIVDEAGPFKEGDKVGPITVMIHNKGTEIVIDLEIKLTNKGLAIPSIPSQKGISIARNTTYLFEIEEYKISSDADSLAVELIANNSFGLPLSEERGELNYTQNYWAPLIKGSGTTSSGNEDSESSSNTWVWIVIGILLVLVILAIVFFIFYKYRDEHDEFEDDAAPISVTDNRPVEGYSIEPPPLYPPRGGFPFPPYGEPGTSMLLPPVPGAGPMRDRLPPIFGSPNRLALPAGPKNTIPAPGDPAKQLPPFMPPMGMPPGFPGFPGFHGAPPSMPGAPFPMQFPQSPFGYQAPYPPTPFNGPDKERMDEIFSDTARLDEKEGEQGATCSNCGASVQEGWLMCPQCKKRLR